MGEKRTGDGPAAVKKKKTDAPRSAVHGKPADAPRGAAHRKPADAPRGAVHGKSADAPHSAAHEKPASGRAQNRRKRKRRRRLDAARILFIGCGAILAIAVLLAGAYGYIRWHGAHSLAARAKDTVLRMPSVETGQQDGTGETEASSDGIHAEALPANGLRYHGKTYLYDEDIRTFLCMGIDRYGEVEASSDLYRGGQADALFLAVLDSGQKKISVIGIPRDTMTEISVYDRNGLYAGTDTAQIALAHAYGEGLEESCENTVDAVSKLFYGLPIHGYCALNMEGIAAINDAVGGVDVVIPESAVNAKTVFHGKAYSADWKAGDRVHLDGQDAYLFLRYRDTNIPESAGERLQRQKQYLQAFIGQARKAVREDLTIPLKLYSQIKPYMTTDISAEEAVYLAGEALDCSFSQDDVYSLQGEVKMGEIFEEFYPDETALYELILHVFYKEL